jgi:hypothetical protein
VWGVVHRSLTQVVVKRAASDEGHANQILFYGGRPIGEPWGRAAGASVERRFGGGLIEDLDLGDQEHTWRLDGSRARVTGVRWR